jgi:hypothetical protein
VCVLDGGGKVVWQGKCASIPEAMAATARRRLSEKQRQICGDLLLALR